MVLFDEITRIRCTKKSSRAEKNRNKSGIFFDIDRIKPLYDYSRYEKKINPTQLKKMAEKRAYDLKNGKKNLPEIWSVMVAKVSKD